MRLGQHLARGVPVELGGNSYVVGPITLDEFAEFQEYLFRKPLEDVAEFCKDHPEMRDVMVTQAMKEVKEMRQQSGGEKQSFGYMMAAMTDVGNMRHLLYICIKKNHPDVNRDEIMRLVTLDSLPSILMDVLEASGLDDSQANPTSRQPKKEEESNERSEATERMLADL